MEESDEDEEDNEEFLERLMAQTGRAMPRQELEEHYSVLGELGSGTYGRVVLTEPRDGGEGGTGGHWGALGLPCGHRDCTATFLAGGFSHRAVLCRVVPGQARPQPCHSWQGTAPGLPSTEGLAEELVKRCSCQLAQALDFMHNRALVHRDVKLDNVLLFDPECQRVKLGDFGLTRLQGTPVGAMSSPLPYSPPELCQLRGADTLELDASLDVWAFAVLIFCLCTGCFPWSQAANPDPQFRAFRAWHSGHEGAEVPTPWRSFAPGALEMFRRLLNLDPDRRSPAVEVQRYLALPWL
ncbi:SBK1 kinase, partial [Alcedo cyanopectus]|nr:SBK1 kinase [Ceyx cyanopectus]